MSRCRCGGSGSFCKHSRERRKCKESSAICTHNRIKSRCKERGGSGICQHGRLKSRAVQRLGRQRLLRARARPTEEPVPHAGREGRPAPSWLLRQRTLRARGRPGVHGRLWPASGGHGLATFCSAGWWMVELECAGNARPTKKAKAALVRPAAVPGRGPPSKQQLALRARCAQWKRAVPLPLPLPMPMPASDRCCRCR